MDSTVQGIDISHWQGVFDFKKAQANNYKFCFIKATEGTQYIDHSFKRSWVEGPQHGILCGAYHFYHPSEYPEKQAEHFLDTIGPAFVGQLPCVLDLETTDHVRNGQVTAGALKWLQMVHEHTGTLPILYTGPSFCKHLGDMSAFAVYPLWIAHYGVKIPRVPKAWVDYKFWQYSSAGGLDRNVFNGSLAELRAMAHIS